VQYRVYPNTHGAGLGTFRLRTFQKSLLGTQSPGI